MVPTPGRRQPTDSHKLVPFIALGFGIGLFLGYIFLGTLHAVIALVYAVLFWPAALVFHVIFPDPCECLEYDLY